MWGGNASSGNSAAKDDVQIGNSDIKKNGVKFARNSINHLIPGFKGAVRGDVPHDVDVGIYPIGFLVLGQIFE